MSDTQNITLHEFERRYPSLLNDIYGVALEDGPTMEPVARPLFCNEGWRAILLPGQIGSLDKRNSIDEPECIESSSAFWRPVNWLEAIMIAHWTRPEPFVFQAYTAIFGTQWKPETERCVVCRVPAIADQILAAGTPPDGPYWSDMIFDPLGEWGMIDVADEPMTILGAKGQLFCRIVEMFGGMSNITDQFSEYLSQIETVNRISDQRKDELNEYFLSHYRPLYDRIGWPWPFPDHIGRNE